MPVNSYFTAGLKIFEIIARASGRSTCYISVGNVRVGKYREARGKMNEGLWRQLQSINSLDVEIQSLSW